MASQCGQDLFVLEVLDGLTGGFFLDSGASDGIRSSNTYLLETAFQWKGICIEPNREYYAALVQNRRCICLECCLYDRESDVEFLEGAEQLGGILSEYHPRHLRYAESEFPAARRVDGGPAVVVKSARTIRSVLRDCAAPPVIDYWSLDTEGSELTILKSFPFGEYSFRVLTVEHNWLPVRDAIKDFLETRGYERIKALEVDDCYVKRGHLPRPMWRSYTWRMRGRPR